MAINLNGTTGITTTGLTSNGIDDNATSTAMTLDTSGNVGIGTSSPSGASGKTLAINGGSGQTRLALKNTSTGDASGDGFQISIGTDGSAGIEQRENNYMAFSTNATERMRLDTSGNVLVGKTAQNSDNAGVELRAGGQTTATRSASWVGLFNRLTDDGDIVRFQKDSTTVGSIGVDAGDNLYIGSTAANHGGIYMNDSGVLPMSAGAVSDNTRDLGNPSFRWNDLFLGGGVYLGGTGSANKLDDYEEGTWTITDGTGAGLSFTVQDNVYTKAGRLVVASANITWPSTSNTSAARIVLPFTSIPNNSHSGGVVTEQNWNTSVTLTASCNYTNGVIFRQRGGSSLTNANLSGKKLRFTVTYHAA